MVLCKNEYLRRNALADRQLGNYYILLIERHAVFRETDMLSIIVVSTCFLKTFIYFKCPHACYITYGMHFQSLCSVARDYLVVLV